MEVDKTNTAPCSKGRSCALMERALDGQDSNGARRGFEYATRMNFKTGKSTSDHIVYRCRGRNAPLPVCLRCPFCGESIKGTDP